MKKKPSKSELKTDNELRKLKLTLEHGAQFKGSEELPPEVENEFLKHIEAFEKQAKEKKVTTIRKRLGKNNFKPVEDLSDKDVKRELASALKLLSDKQITIDTICDVDDRELYRFISEELIELEINDIDVPGMVTHFIYEEFYPNHPHDVRCVVEEYVESILTNKENSTDEDSMESYRIFLDFTTSTKANHDMIANQLLMFHSSFSDFDIKDFEILSLNIFGENETAQVQFDLHYDAKIAGSSETITHKGTGIAQLINSYEETGVHFWQILSFEIPGLKLS